MRTNLINTVLLASLALIGSGCAETDPVVDSDDTLQDGGHSDGGSVDSGSTDSGSEDATHQVAAFVNFAYLDADNVFDDIVKVQADAMALERNEVYETCTTQCALNLSDADELKVIYNDGDTGLDYFARTDDFTSDVVQVNLCVDLSNTTWSCSYDDNETEYPTEIGEMDSCEVTFSGLESFEINGHRLIDEDFAGTISLDGQSARVTVNDDIAATCTRL